MVEGKMAPSNVDVPKAVSLDYFNEVCPKEERYIINGNDLRKGLPWDPPAKSNFQCPPGEGVCTVHQDTERHGADIRLHVRLLYHPPRMISTIRHPDLFGTDHALDLWPIL